MKKKILADPASVAARVQQASNILGLLIGISREFNEMCWSQEEHPYQATGSRQCECLTLFIFVHAKHLYMHKPAFMTYGIEYLFTDLNQFALA